MSESHDPAENPFGMSPEELMRRLAAGSLGPAELEAIQREISANLGMDLPPQMLQQAMQQMQQMMNSPDTGPLNEDLARAVARQTVAQGSDPVVGEADRRRVLDALRVAALWLDEATALPAPAIDEHAWSGAEWVEATMTGWLRLCEPVAQRVSTELSRILAEQVPPEARAMIGEAETMMRKMGGGAFGSQVGQAIGNLAKEVNGAHDIGLPLVPAGTTALLPANVRVFGDGLEVPDQDVLLYLALREGAYARLFAHAPWLREHVLSTVDAFARGISIDVAALESSVRSLDLSDPEALRQALAGGVFEPDRTPAQQEALAKLEVVLALIEGWVDEVAHAAAHQLPSAPALREAVRRRRAVGGPAEHTLATLVGLELRPRRLRDAATLWAAVAAGNGTQARDDIWNHPDLMPSGQDLDDPIGYAEHYRERLNTPDDLDAELRKLLGD